MPRQLDHSLATTIVTHGRLLVVESCDEFPSLVSLYQTSRVLNETWHRNACFHPVMPLFVIYECKN